MGEGGQHSRAHGYSIAQDGPNQPRGPSNMLMGASIRLASFRSDTNAAQGRQGEKAA